MKGLGFFSWFGIPLPFEERLGLARGAGFESTGFWLGPEEEMIRTGHSESMPGLIREKGLYLDYVHAPDAGCNDLWSGQSWRRRDASQQVNGHIRFCRRHAIPHLVMHLTASKGHQPDQPNGKGLETVRDIVKRAEDARVILAAENTQTPHFLDFIFSEIESPSLRFCYDTSHDFLYSPEPGSLLRKWGHLLSVTHLGDNDGRFDRHWLPGRGCLPWNAVRRYFPIRKFEGFLNLEVFPEDPKQRGEDFLRDAYQSARWLREFLSWKEGT